jgi:hypothetical protein
MYLTVLARLGEKSPLGGSCRSWSYVSLIVPLSIESQSQMGKCCVKAESPLLLFLIVYLPVEVGKKLPNID